MSQKILTNAEAFDGEGDSPIEIAYRMLVGEVDHNALCRAYGLDQDHENGGTHYSDVVRQAIMHGDLDIDNMELT